MESYNATSPFALSQGTASVGMIAGANVPTPAAPTLVRALSSIEELNKRLFALCNQANEIAQSVGGPYPVNPQGKEANPPSSAMQKLNDSIATAHNAAADIEGALSAMRRALGA